MTIEDHIKAIRSHWRNGRCAEISDVEAVISRLAEAERDARRYRWFREKLDSGNDLPEHFEAIRTGEKLDAAIDFDLTAPQQEQK